VLLGRAAVLLGRAEVLLGRGRLMRVRLRDLPVELGEAVELVDGEVPAAVEFGDDVEFDDVVRLARGT
jgi:hypothetical protein